MLNENIIALEKDPSDSSIIQEIFRIAHTLKSSAAFINQDQLSRLAHKMEDVFQLVKDGQVAVSTGLITSLFQCLDRIKQSVLQIEKGEATTVQFDDLIAGLDQARQRRKRICSDDTPGYIGRRIRSNRTGCRNSAAGFHRRAEPDFPLPLLLPSPRRKIARPESGWS